MIASSFTNFPSGTRRYLPALSLWSRVHRWFGRRLTLVQSNLPALSLWSRVHRWFGRRLTLVQSNALWLIGSAALIALTLVLRGLV